MILIYLVDYLLLLLFYLLILFGCSMLCELFDRWMDSRFWIQYLLTLRPYPNAPMFPVVFLFICLIPFLVSLLLTYLSSLVIVIKPPCSSIHRF